MKTCVLIPAYNEAATIAGLIKRIHAYNLPVVVVDDGSLDGTGRLACTSGATVLRNELNQGKGASLLKGFKFVLENNFEAVIIMDADGQHLASDVEKFIALALERKHSFIVGNRLDKRRDMPLVRFLTNKFMSWFISQLCGQEVADSQCGFRLISSEVLQGLRLASAKYEIESELIIKAAQKGIRIESLKINSVYDGSISNIQPWRDSWRFIRFILKEVWITSH